MHTLVLYRLSISFTNLFASSKLFGKCSLFRHEDKNSITEYWMSSGKSPSRSTKSGHFSNDS